MIRRVTNSIVVQRALLARSTVADGSVDLSSSWLEAADRVTIAEESGALLDPEDTPRLREALHRVGVDHLLAISNEPLMDEVLTYELLTSVEDLNALSSELAGINTVLVPSKNLDVAILCTVDDFRLVAGAREFVLSYVDDATAARTAFIEFANNHEVPELQAALQRAATYMNWIDE
jgi:hypothetical protein